MDIDQLLTIADRSIAQGKIDEAAKCCSRALEAAPNHARALHLLALIKYQNGEVDEALKLLENAINTSPDFAMAHNTYGGILMGANRLPEAIDALRNGVQLEPGFAEAHVNLGVAMHKMGQLKEAEDHYRLALSINPDHVRGLTSLGNLLRIFRRADEAVECFNAALKVAPGAAEIHSFLGTAYLDLRQRDKALDSFRAALELQPDLPEANFSLGAKAVGEKRFLDAIQFFERANTPISRSLLLNCLLHLERYDDFFSRLESIARVDPTNMRIASISAYAAQQLQRPDGYPFWPDPMSYIRVVDNTGGIGQNDQFLALLIEQAKSLDLIWEPKGASTNKGYRSETTLFDDPTGHIALLKEIILAEVETYRRTFASADALFAKQWPRAIHLDGWFNRLLKEGFQEAHNHPEGWLSGCIYLRVPSNATPPEGAIEFSLKGPGYPTITQDNPVRVHVPTTGQLVLFPASLFHRTIPFFSDEERLAIAFDVSPS